MRSSNAYAPLDWMNDMKKYFTHSLNGLCVDRDVHWASDENYCIRSTTTMTFDLSTYANRIQSILLYVYGKHMESHHVSINWSNMSEESNKSSNLMVFNSIPIHINFAISLSLSSSLLQRCRVLFALNRQCSSAPNAITFRVWLWHCGMHCTRYSKIRIYGNGNGNGNGWTVVGVVALQ